MGKNIVFIAKEMECLLNQFKLRKPVMDSDFCRYHSRPISRLVFRSLPKLENSDNSNQHNLCRARFRFDCERFLTMGKKVKLLNCIDPNVGTQQRRLFSTAMKPKTHYEVLNVSKTASSEEIRQAFILLSKTWHPDINNDDPTGHQKFVKINEAYSILSKPLSRRDYDLSLEAEKYVSRQMNAAASRTHGYGYSPHAGPYYHYRDHVYDETYWSGEAHSSDSGKLHVLMNFYLLIACATLAAVSIIMHYMYRYIPNPKHHHLRQDLSLEDVEKHEFIMQSEQDGVPVYYYAIPKKGSNKFDILVLKKTESKDSDNHKMHEVTRSS